MTGNSSGGKKTRSILHGVRIHIVDKNIPAAKLRILENVVTKHGGTITERVNVDDKVLILADFENVEDLRRSFNNSKPKREFWFTDKQCKNMCRLEWLTLSIKHGSVLPFDSFRLVSEPSHSSASEDSSEVEESTLLHPDYVNDGWHCRHKCPLEHPNSDITSCLSQIMHHRSVTGDARSEFSYAKAIAALAGYPRRISSAEEAAAIKGIGPKIAAMIGEFLSSGRMEEVERLKEDKRFHVLNQLCGIHGVGFKTAEKWLSLGIDSVEKVKEAVERKQIKLSEQQRLGLAHYKDLQIKMTRSQVEDINELIKAALPPDCEFHVTGGYRRGKPYSNDVDVLVLSQDVNCLDRILSNLDDHVVGVLQLARSTPPPQVQRTVKPSQPGAFDHLGKCLMLLKHPNDETVRRVDIIHVPNLQVLPWAQLGWTGSRMFERSIRLYADRKLHIHLSSDGAYCTRTKSYLHADTEQDCFRLLGLDYIEPECRNC